MSREKQIEEMANDIAETIEQVSYKCLATACVNCKVNEKRILAKTVLRCRSNLIADNLIEKGYRKQSEGEWRSELVKRCDWKGKKHDYYQPNSCSLCHEAVVKRTPFCPNCGAKMKGEQQ